MVFSCFEYRSLFMLHHHSMSNRPAWVFCHTSIQLSPEIMWLTSSTKSLKSPSVTCSDRSFTYKRRESAPVLWCGILISDEPERVLLSFFVIKRGIKERESLLLGILETLNSNLNLITLHCRILFGCIFSSDKHKTTCLVWFCLFEAIAIL